MDYLINYYNYGTPFQLTLFEMWYNTVYFIPLMNIDIFMGIKKSISIINLKRVLKSFYGRNRYII